jgi:hypothetical protein
MNTVRHAHTMSVLRGGKVTSPDAYIQTTIETTIAGAKARATHLRSLLESRGTHAEVFTYCRSELLQENYFHAVLEAVKGLAERIRKM